MSAIRRIDRRPSRNEASSPYSRPTASEEPSPWSISGFLASLFPFRPFRPLPENEPTELFQDDNEVSAAPNLPNGHQDNSSQPPTPPPPAALATSHPPLSTTSAPNAFSLPTNLPSNPNLSLSEVNHIYDPIVGSIDTYDNPNPRREPFRLASARPIPSSERINVMTSSGSSRSPKTLNKNPNGTYRWRGGGSARPHTRYRSPAFGSPRPPASMKLPLPDVPMSEVKRRRLIGPKGSSSSSERPTPAGRPSSPLPSAGSETSQAFAFPIPADRMRSESAALMKKGIPPPRLRTDGLRPLTNAPAIPSPLRQVWGQGDNEPSSSSHTKKTKAAEFMTKLIKEVTPPKKPDLSNPYQTASPVKPPPKKPVKQIKPTVPAPAKMKEPEMSPQAIIEATVPRGSKRSRPPNHLRKASSIDNETSSSSGGTPPRSPRPEPTHSGVNGISHKRNTEYRSPIVIDDDEDDEEDDRASKRRKSPTINGSGYLTRNRTVTMEDVDDVDMPLASAPPRPAQNRKVQNKHPTDPRQPVPIHSTEVAAKPCPSNLQQSFPIRPTQIVEDKDKSTSKPPPPSPIHPPKDENKPSSEPSQPVPVRPARTTDLQDKFAFKPSQPSTPPPVSGSSQTGGRISKSSAPKEPSKLRYEVASEPALPPSHQPSQKRTNMDPPPVPERVKRRKKKEMAEWYPGTNWDKVEPKKIATIMHVNNLPVYRFYGKRRLYPTSHAAARNAAEAAPKSSLPTFNLSVLATGWGTFKPVSTSRSTETTSQKPLKPAGENAPPDAPVFDYAAAGMKPQAKTGAWTCSLCALENPPSAVDKCQVCETPR